ncbi:hypothetical protein BGN33_05420 [Salmonella enterica subsp. enterica serovar Enteritidis]|nr:hypothetical protein [Salmonella enterica subsp. enterica serovar Enteritidis]
MSKNKDQRSAKMDEEITAVETTIADAPVSDVIAQPETVAVEKKETVVEEKPAKPAVKESPAVSIVASRAATLVAPFQKYAEEMGPTMPQTPQSLIRHQRSLMSAFRALLDVDNPEVFRAAFADILKIWKDNSEGAFNANRYLYRGIDNMPLDYHTRMAFLTVLRLMDAIYDESRRQVEIRAIDLNIAIPEIAYFDTRNYLAGYMRRFA